MPGELLNKRKIAVLGSRSVGMCFHPIRSPVKALPPNHLHSLHNLGKSSLVIQFIENHFVESYYPTIEGHFTKSISYKGVEYECDIIDTAGQVCLFFSLFSPLFFRLSFIINPTN